MVLATMFEAASSGLGSDSEAMLAIVVAVALIFTEKGTLFSYKEASK